MSKKIWVLQGTYPCYGVYSTLEKLSKGIDYWMKESPREILSYAEWNLNYVQEPNSWEWAYIPLHAKLSRLTRGGGTPPLRKYWGHNLLALQKRGIDVFPEAGERLNQRPEGF